MNMALDLLKASCTPVSRQSCVITVTSFPDRVSVSSALQPATWDSMYVEVSAWFQYAVCKVCSYMQFAVRHLMKLLCHLPRLLAAELQV